jgi:hypothetical protein
VLYFDNFVRLGYQERPFGDDQPFNRNIANDEELGVDGATSGLNVPTGESCQIYKPIRWNEIADFFVYFPDGALQERFVPFAVAAEQRHLSRVQDSGNIIALLKQEPAAGVDQNGARDFAMS